jgi:uncharacterized protein YjbJ (UPF0337 family)
MHFERSLSLSNRPRPQANIAVQSAIGSVTGSPAWQSSGEQAKAHAAGIMKAAGENRNASTQGYGKVEEVAGKITGCEGMQHEGAASKKPE